MPNDSRPAPDSPERPGPPQSTLSAEQLLTRMLELLSTRRQISDVDLDAVRSLAPDADVDLDGPRLRQIARLTPQWRYLLQFDPDEPIGPMLHLEFFDSQGGVDAPLTEIAHIDLDQFSARMRTIGFAEQEIADELGGSRGRDFTAGDLRVTVTSIGEADSPADSVAHRCIRSITVR